MHSVLPTKLKTPIGAHWQGSWLLSVDRQEVQDIGENAWNRSLVEQAARLLIALLRWCATVAPPSPAAAYGALPLIESSTNAPAAASPTVAADRGGRGGDGGACLLYTSPSPRDGLLSRMPSSA